MVAFGGFQVDVVEPGQVGAFPPGDRHAEFVGLLDVAAPQLVHALEQLLVGQGRSLGVGQAQLVVELRLSGGEAVSLTLGLPTEMVQGSRHPGADQGGLVGGGLRQGGDPGIGDGGLHGGRQPAVVHHGRADPHGERLVAAGVGDERLQVGVDVGAFPVEDGSLGQVGQVAGQLRQLSVQDESHSGEGVAVEEPNGLGTPLRFHLSPCGKLQEARLPTSRHEGQVLVGADRLDGDAHDYNLPAAAGPLAGFSGMAG